MLKTEIKPISRKSNLVIQEFGNEILIYDLANNKAFNLNESSAIIWQLCDGNKTIFDLAKNVSARFNSVITEDFVRLALEQLKRDKLLENAEEVFTDFDGLSRREVIRKVGFATIVALPIVSSLIAPTATNASSTICSQSIQGCTGANRPRGCTCSPGTNAGNPSIPDGGTSNCAAGLRCFLNRPLTYSGAPVGGMGNACC